MSTGFLNDLASLNIFLETATHKKPNGLFITVGSFWYICSYLYSVQNLLVFFIFVPCQSALIFSAKIVS